MGLSKSMFAQICLTAFFGARVQSVENEDGEMEECVCIPIDRNELYRGYNGRVYASAFVNETNVASSRNWTHYLTMKASSGFVKKMTSLGYKMPFLGNLKKANYVVKKKNEDSSKRRVKISGYE